MREKKVADLAWKSKFYFFKRSSSRKKEALRLLFMLLGAPWNAWPSSSSIFKRHQASCTFPDALKKQNFCSVVKQKQLLLKQAHQQNCLKFAQKHENWTVEDWKRVLWSDETKINRIGSDGRVYTWKEKGTPLSDRTTTPIVKHGGGNNLMVWGCMGWNGVEKLTEVEGKMDAVQYYEILEDGVVKSFEKRWRWRRGSFSKTMILNIPQKRKPSGLKTTTFKSFYGLPNLQTSTLLNTCGCTWRSWGNIQNHQRRLMNCGRKWQKRW